MSGILWSHHSAGDKRSLAALRLPTAAVVIAATHWKTVRATEKDAKRRRNTPQQAGERRAASLVSAYLPAWRNSVLLGCCTCRLGVRDMGVKFHPRVELELVERVKRRRTERRDAAQQVNSI